MVIQMLRLETVLPEWTRVIWTTPAAREKWETILHDITSAWTRIEKWAVVDGARDSCLTMIEPERLPELSRWATRQGLLVLPMGQVGLSDQYSASSMPIAAGRPWQYRVVLCRPEHRGAWFEAWDTATTNDEVIGQLLGFPECCRRFFEKVWIEEKYLDTTWPMAESTAWIDDNELREQRRLIGVGGHDACNILWRWMGVRAVAHLPCSFDCKATVDVAKMFRQVAIDFDRGEWMDLTEEILSWPVEWSALHGIAEIKTPILKVSSRTDMTAEKYVVQREGSGYPVEGASGISFPYQNRQRVQVTKTPAFARAFDESVVKTSILEAARATKDPIDSLDLWTDNGFSSLEAMNEAHAVLLEATPIDELAAGDTVLDLGCGNGRLLQRLAALVPANLELYGIEAVADRCRRARLNGGRVLTVYQGSMFDPEIWGALAPDLVYFMPGRLLEETRLEPGVTLRGLLRQSPRAVFYAYGDWLEKGGILELLQKVWLEEGWETVGTVDTAPNAQAILARRR